MFHKHGFLGPLTLTLVNKPGNKQSTTVLISTTSFLYHFHLSMTFESFNLLEHCNIWSQKNKATHAKPEPNSIFCADVLPSTVKPPRKERRLSDKHFTIIKPERNQNVSGFIIAAI